MGKPGGNRLLGGPRHRWQDNIKMELREIVYSGMDWIELAQDRNQQRAVMSDWRLLKKGSATRS
jgi:hypothetical protein